MSERVDHGRYRTAESQAAYFTVEQAPRASMDRSLLAHHPRPGGRYGCVLSETTEPSEGVSAGTARLVGCDRSEIAWRAAPLLHNERSYAATAQAASPYGDGIDGERIADLLAEAVERGERDAADLLSGLGVLTRDGGADLESPEHV